MNASTRSLRPLLALALLAACLGSSPAGAGEAMEHHHHHPMTADAVVRTEARYQLPDVMLMDADGRSQSLRTLVDQQAPLMLNFIFTSCTSICPVMSGVFAQVQSRLAAVGKPARLVSISIDPEYDTPDRLSAYARNLSAGPEWLMLTGRLQDSVAVQRAFDVYRGDKMNHLPTTFLRVAPDQPWVRLDGLASADDLIAEYRRLTAAQWPEQPGRDHGHM
jgi:protein SCO1/2